MSASFSAISIDVIDPMNRSGKITVPSQYVIETRGLLEFWNGTSSTKDLSLCLLFQKGRCNAGARCHQVHASPAFVAKLRAQAEAGKACCALHGDYQSSGFLSDARHVTVTGATNASYPLSSFGRTAALDVALRNGSSVKVQAAKICRLHAKGQCKFGKDCKNIHLCPTATACAATSTGIAFRASEGPLEKSLAMENSSICGLSTTCSTPTKNRRSVSNRTCSSPDDSPKERSLPSVSSPAPSAVAPLALFADDTIWNTGKMSSINVASPSAWMSGFESSLSLVCEDLAHAKCSPSFGQF